MGMKILFLDNRSPKIGSTRIWVHNLHHWLCQLGIEAALNDTEDLARYDVVILGKGLGSLKWVDRIESENPSALVGWVNTSIEPRRADSETRRRNERIDFLLVGSVEERDFRLQFKREIFIFPLIERLYTGWKEHTDHQPIVLGYHGNSAHLLEFSPHLTGALEILAGEISMKLIAVHNLPEGWQWRLGRPSFEIEEHEWDFDTVEELLLRCDIGLVPYSVPLSEEGRARIIKTWGDDLQENSGMAGEDDFLLRIKCNSNAGRAFVFHQLGIPVVGEFAPSHFHVLGDPRCGFLAHSTAGWLDALRVLCASATKRREVAEAASREFKRLYDPLDWARRLVDQIQRLRKA